MKLPQLFSLDGLESYYFCVVILFMRTGCNKCVIELCYNSWSIVCVSITDPGMTLKHRDFGPLGSWSLQDGIRANVDCRT